MSPDVPKTLRLHFSGFGKNTMYKVDISEDLDAPQVASNFVDGQDYEKGVKVCK